MHRPPQPADGPWTPRRRRTGSRLERTVEGWPVTRSVVVLCLDTVRKDVFDSQAVQLRRMADVEWHRCRAAAPCTVPSHGSMVTGQLPSESGIHSKSTGYHHVEPNDAWLSRYDGHTKIGVSANPYLSREQGFDRFFDEFVEWSIYQRFSDGINVRHFYNKSDARGLRFYGAFLKAAIEHESTVQSIGNALTAQAFQTLNRLPIPGPLDGGVTAISREIKRRLEPQDGPSFVFANIMDAHGPLHQFRHLETEGVPLNWSSVGVDEWELIYADGVPEPFREYVSTYRAVYSATVAYMDTVLADLVRFLIRSRPTETTVIVTADHGENLGHAHEDGQWGHVSSLTDSLLHVPFLLFNPPEGFDEPDRGYISLRQLGLVLDAIQADTPAIPFEDVVGAELLGSPIQEASLVESRYEYFGRAIRSAYRDGEKVQWDTCGNIQLMDVGSANSRQEKVKELETVPEWADEPFSEELRVSQDDPDSNMSTTTKSRLEDLGYIT